MFVRNFFRGLAHCAFDEPECAVLAAACIFIGYFLYIFFQVGYDLIFDPNATDVAARLASIFISPENWM
jgi:hypothetical protein